MGNAGARHFGLGKAYLTVDESVTELVKVVRYPDFVVVKASNWWELSQIDPATREKISGRFWENTGKEWCYQDFFARCLSTRTTCLAQRTLLTCGRIDFTLHQRAFCLLSLSSVLCMPSISSTSLSHQGLEDRDIGGLGSTSQRFSASRENTNKTESSLQSKQIDHACPIHRYLVSLLVRSYIST